LDFKSQHTAPSLNEKNFDKTHNMLVSHFHMQMKDAKCEIQEVRFYFHNFSKTFAASFCSRFCVSFSKLFQSLLVSSTGLSIKIMLSKKKLPLKASVAPGILFLSDETAKQAFNIAF
jgi:hypothetical protein